MTNSIIETPFWIPAAIHGATGVNAPPKGERHICGVPPQWLQKICSPSPHRRMVLFDKVMEPLSKIDSTGPTPQTCLTIARRAWN